MNEKYSKFMEEIKEIVETSNQDVTNENANMSGQEPQGMMSILAGAVSKHFSKENHLKPAVAKAFEEGCIHIHDFDFYASGTTTCLQIPLGKMLKGGFSIRDSHMREPSNIHSAMSLMAVLFQAHQNLQHGGQAMSAVDYELAPYVKKTYEKNLELVATLGHSNSQAEQLAWELTEKDTLQASEAYVHNMNTMLSRGGGQVVFSSINFGIDTSREGRLVAKCLLQAMYNGVGDGQQAIFPIMIYQLKEGINMYEEDPNYDIFQQALKTTSKRFFPNYAFLDASFNKCHFDVNKPETWASYMGCRTRTLENINGENRTIGRGNLSFSTINLPMLALKSSSTRSFFARLDKYADLVIEQLYDRYLYQASKKAKNFPLIFSGKTYYNSEHINPEDTIEDALKNSSLSVGFIGLAECLTALIGEHHGESEDAYELGLEIIKFLNKKTDEAKEKYKLNFAVLATPAESYCGKALKMTRKKFGIVRGVTDKEYFTNSYHIPVGFPISVTDKIELEGVFHKLCLGGHISYIELDGSPVHNIKAMERIVLHAKDCDMGYFAINIPVDRCLECGYIGQIDNSCPSCDNKRETRIKRIRRITGYLTGDMDRWNTAKQAEESQRVKHGRD